MTDEYYDPEEDAAIMRAEQMASLIFNFPGSFGPQAGPDPDDERERFLEEIYWQESAAMEREMEKKKIDDKNIAYLSHFYMDQIRSGEMKGFTRQTHFRPPFTVVILQERHGRVGVGAARKCESDEWSDEIGEEVATKRAVRDLAKHVYATVLPSGVMVPLSSPPDWLDEEDRARFTEIGRDS